MIIGNGNSEDGNDYATFVTTQVYDQHLIKGEDKGIYKKNVTNFGKKFYS